jgi:hypothetical protein
MGSQATVRIQNIYKGCDRVSISVADPYVFGPPGSGSFHHQAKEVRKSFISTV